MARRKSTAGYDEHRDALAQAVSDGPVTLILEGTEPVLVDEALASHAGALRRAHPALETVTLQAGEAGGAMADVLLELDTPSLFASERLIVVRHAGRILFPTGEGVQAAQAAERILPWIENPSGGTGSVDSWSDRSCMACGFADLSCSTRCRSAWPSRTMS